MLLAFLEKKYCQYCHEKAIHNNSKYLHNRNVFEYAQIARSGPKSMILKIEASSIKYIILTDYFYKNT